MENQKINLPEEKSYIEIDNTEKDVVILWQFWEEYPDSHECIHIPRRNLLEFIGHLQQCRKEVKNAN